MTPDEYRVTAQKVLRTVAGSSPDVRSCLLHGSVARGETRPGLSDLIDALVIIENEAFTSFDTFATIMQNMAAACGLLRACDCPTHPFQYYLIDEVMTSYPATLLAIWTDESKTIVSAGEDIRSRIATSRRSAQLSRLLAMSFFRGVQHLGAYLGQDTWRQRDCRFVSQSLIRYCKVVPSLVCIAFDIWLEHSEASMALRSLAPNIEISTLQELRAMCLPSAIATETTIRSMLEKNLPGFLRLGEVVLDAIPK